MVLGDGLGAADEVDELSSIGALAPGGSAGDADDIVESRASAVFAALEDLRELGHGSAETKDR